MRTSNEEIFKYISMVRGVTQRKLQEMVRKRFNKTANEARELIWAYQLQ